MSSRDNLSIIEVLENLNTIVEADSLDQIEVTEDGSFVRKGEARRDVYWIQAGANEETINAIRTTFRAIHKYLVTFYRKMKSAGNQKQMVEGVGTIMVLVGEAEKKLEKFDTLFKERIPKLEEYKTLQNFYRNHVAKESTIELVPPHPRLSEEEEWEREFEELLAKTPIEEIDGVHLLNDIETVKNDHLYELFYIKNEAGQNFYTNDLARNIKLACDFGEFAGQYFADDPLLQIKNWEDKGVHILAKRILRACSKSIEKFYKGALKYREIEIVFALQKALMALLLSANPKTMIRNFSVKGSHLYFRDFQLFLREALSNREYQRFLLYSPPASTPFFADCLTLIHDLAFHAFTESPHHYELEKALKEMAKKKGNGVKIETLSNFLEKSDANLRKVLEGHPSGPIFKALDLVREEEERSFDPLILGNLPEVVGSLKMGNQEATILRLPCPTSQEYVDHAAVTEDFKAFLHALAEKGPYSLLYFNFQDRTSWKEHSRCKVLEELSQLAEFSTTLTVVTMTKDSDFYNQQDIYHDLTQASDFIVQFLDHLQDESTGYYFPQHLKKELFPAFGKKLLQTIHETFFETKKSLSVRERLDFIEITYHFIELKVIELVTPSYLTLTSKDGLDIAGESIVGLMALLEMGAKKKWKHEEFEAMLLALYGPTLLHRERAIHPEVFERLHEMVRLLEEKKDFMESTTTLFKGTTLGAQIRFYKENEGA